MAGQGEQPLQAVLHEVAPLRPNYAPDLVPALAQALAHDHPHLCALVRSHPPTPASILLAPAAQRGALQRLIDGRWPLGQLLRCYVVLNFWEQGLRFFAITARHRKERFPAHYSDEVLIPYEDPHGFDTLAAHLRKIFPAPPERDRS